MKTKPNESRIYILPTRFGGVFIAGSLVMILVGAAYQNNLVNLLAYFMFGLIFVAMVQTHNNLKDVGLETVDVEPGFAGGEYIVALAIHNSSPETRFNIEFHLRGTSALSTSEPVQPLSGFANQKLRASYRATTRGRHTIHDIRLSTVFPLGLFRAWRWFRTDTSFLVYPSLKGDKQPPWGGLRDEEIGPRTALGGDDFHGHRRFQAGDSYSHVDWKAFARSGKQLTKVFTEGSVETALLDWFSLDGLSAEDRLSQLAVWIESARLNGKLFALRLPDLGIPPGKGPRQARRCLEACALYEQPTTRGSRETRNSAVG